ncbi:MAG: hypothetical protein ACRDSH_07480, partial [Pseudonocardiaceae bacterium]
MLALDIDVVRAMLGGWLDHPMEAGLIERGMAVEMARVQLRAGGDVLVPQFLGRSISSSSWSNCASRWALSSSNLSCSAAHRRPPTALSNGWPAQLRSDQLVMSCGDSQD